MDLLRVDASSHRRSFVCKGHGVARGVAMASDLWDIELPCPEDELFLAQASSWADSSTPPADAPTSPGTFVAEQTGTDPRHPAQSQKRPRPRPHAEERPQQQQQHYSVETLDDKRKQRLERNRQSAQDLRKRKREYTSRVEAECDKFRAQAVSAQARVSALSAENAVLREENAFYRGIVQGRAATPATPTAGGSAAPGFDLGSGSGGATPPRSQRKMGAGALALSFVAVLGLSGYGGGGGAASEGVGAAARRAMASDGDDSLALALPGATASHQAAWFQPTAGHAGAVGSSGVSLTQALLPYLHAHGESGAGEQALDWVALAQLGKLQLGADVFIFFPVDLHGLGWFEATASSAGGGDRRWLDVPRSTASIAAPTVASILIEEGAEQRAWPILVVEEPAAAADDSAPKVVSTAASGSGRQGRHVDRVLHMLSSMTQVDKKLMLHLLTTDAEAEGDENSDGTPGQWSAASPALSSLSILLPAGTGEGAEVVEVSCGLVARRWRVGAEADA